MTLRERLRDPFRKKLVAHMERELREMAEFLLHRGREIANHERRISAYRDMVACGKCRNVRSKQWTRCFVCGSGEVL